MVDPGYLAYLEIVGSGYLSPCSFSWFWEDLLYSTKHTLNLVEEVVVVEEVDEAWGARALVPEGLECLVAHTDNKEMGQHWAKLVEHQLALSFVDMGGDMHMTCWNLGKGFHVEG